jgi:hypothetical protein
MKKTNIGEYLDSRSTTKVVKISPETKQILTEISKKSGIKLFRVLDDAVKFYAQNLPGYKIK